MAVRCWAHCPGPRAAAGPQQTALTAQPGTGRAARAAVPKALLSFGEEMDTDDAAGSSFSLADSTERKWVFQSSHTAFVYLHPVVTGVAEQLCSTCILISP